MKSSPLWMQTPNPMPIGSSALVTPLERDEIGATTGYRYYVPVTDHTANKIVSVLNAQVAALLGPYRRTLAWGVIHGHPTEKFLQFRRPQPLARGPFRRLCALLLRKKQGQIKDSFRGQMPGRLGGQL